MSEHLSDRELAAAMGGSPEADEHLRVCEACRKEAAGLRDAVRGWRESLAEEAERDEMFWTRQRLSVKHRLLAGAPARWPRWVALAGTALLLAAVLLLTPAPPATRMANAPAPVPAASDEADDLLLRGIEDDMARETPRALEPAMLISAERSSLSFTPSNSGSGKIPVDKEQDQ